MATKGTGYFDVKGNYFKTADEATISDLAGLLGRVGEGDSMAPGIAKVMLERRTEIQAIYAAHDSIICRDPIMPELKVVRHSGILSERN